MGLFDKFKSDEKLLEKVKNDSLNLKDRKDALAKISDEKILFDIAMDENCDTGLRIESIRKISNQDLLMKIAVSYDTGIGCRAVGGLNEKYLLYIIANTNLSVDIRDEALCFISSPSIIKSIAISVDEDPKLRRNAFNKLDDKDLLAKIAKNDENPEVRKHAIEIGRFRKKILEDLLESEEDEDVRKVIEEEKSHATIMRDMVDLM